MNGAKGRKSTSRIYPALLTSQGIYALAVPGGAGRCRVINHPASRCPMNGAKGRKSTSRIYPALLTSQGIHALAVPGDQSPGKQMPHEWG